MGATEIPKNLYAVNNKGFSLIEVLIALAIFAIGSLGIVVLYYSNSNSIRKSQELTQAAYIADNYLSRALSVRYSDMPLFAEDDYEEGEYKVNVAITPAVPVAGGSTKITVRVQWRLTNFNKYWKSYSLEYLRSETRSSGI